MRSYHDPCGVARALDVVGERWALLVVRELLLGPKRFTDLAGGLPGLSQNVLSQRLRELEDAGVVERVRLGPPVGSRVYRLTPRGAELEAVLLALARWGSRVPLSDPLSDALPGQVPDPLDGQVPDPPAPGGPGPAEPGAGRAGQLSPDALALALRTTFDPTAAGDLRVACTFRLDDDVLHAEVRDGRFALARGEHQHEDAVVSTDAATLRAVVFARRPPDDAERAGTLRIDGDRAVAVRLLGCFPRPTPATHPS